MLRLEEYKQASLNSVKEEYRRYIESFSYRPATVNTVLNDSFYLWKNGSKELFWETVESEDFENVAKAALLEVLRARSVVSIAERILSLDVDERLRRGDLSVVADIRKSQINGEEKDLYSFASKYCSHHNPTAYPVYDYYVDRVLRYFQKKDGFCAFAVAELKDYPRFKEILLKFRSHYGLERFTMKQIDRYLWQLGKKYFPKKYGYGKRSQ